MIFVLASWSDWGGFGDCSATCGGGMETRTRTCTNPDNTASETCAGESTMSRGCNPDTCPGEKCTLTQSNS